jgi:hypothetical protein
VLDTAKFQPVLMQRRNLFSRVLCLFRAVLVQRRNFHAGAGTAAKVVALSDAAFGNLRKGCLFSDKESMSSESTWGLA